MNVRSRLRSCTRALLDEFYGVILRRSCSAPKNLAVAFSVFAANGDVMRFSAGSDS